MGLIGQYTPSIACTYCGRNATDTPEGYARPVCYTCRLEQEFSDTYKEEYGSRPRLDLYTQAQMEEFCDSVRAANAL